MINTFKKALPHTLPVFAGYVFLGIAFGFLVISKGFPAWYPVVMSVVIYSGALEFAAIPLLSLPFEPVSAFIMGIMLSVRHLFYGLPMLKKYSDAGMMKFPLIYTLSDETFSIASSVKPPEDVNKNLFYLVISVSDYLYWVLGTVIGSLFGNFIKLDTSGIDFVLTALFIVLFIEQIKTKEGKISGFSGLICSFAVLLVFGAENMVLISMVVILIALLASRRVLSDD